MSKGRKRRADGSSNDTGKDSEATNGTAMSNNQNSVSGMQTSNANTTAGGQHQVTAAKTSVAMVVATPGSAFNSEPKSKVIAVYRYLYLNNSTRIRCCIRPLATFD